MRHGEGWFDRECHGGHDAEHSERHYRAGEVVVAHVEGDDIAARSDQFESTDGGGEVAVGRAGAVGAGCGCSGDADMRQRAEVVQRVTGPMQLRRKLSIPDAAPDRHR